MNKTQPCAVDLLIVAGMALALAVLTIVRLVVVPLLALLVTLLAPRRRPAAEPATPMTPPPTLSSLAADLMALPAKQLMELAGTRRRLPKAQLIGMICAMPI